MAHSTPPPTSRLDRFGSLEFSAAEVAAFRDLATSLLGEDVLEEGTDVVHESVLFVETIAMAYEAGMLRPISLLREEERDITI